MSAKGAQRIELKRVLKELERDGSIGGTRRQGYRNKGELPEVAALEITSQDSDGELLARPQVWVAHEDPPRIIVLPGREEGAGPAIGLGERVLARLSRTAQGYEARVIKRLGASAHRVLGVVHVSPGTTRIAPIDRKSRSEFLVDARDRPTDGPGAALLTGYGGFSVSHTPAFGRGVILFLERGGLYAVAHLRGGGEYGEDWHRQGMLAHKQNVFDDFLAAADFLVQEGHAAHDRLAIMGGSNGGLLVGAAVTQRPSLFRAAVCQVPLLDMVRYHLIRIARLWIPEYGSAEDPEALRWLYAYSPYHHVRDGTPYPAVLLTTGESDSRVDPLHARKMAARLQAATSSSHPILLRIEARAGHGQGKPLSKALEEWTDVWTFVFAELGLEA